MRAQITEASGETGVFRLASRPEQTPAPDDAGRALGKIVVDIAGLPPTN